MCTVSPNLLGEKMWRLVISLVISFALIIEFTMSSTTWHHPARSGLVS